jgi:hypothetical protein
MSKSMNSIFFHCENGARSDHLLRAALVLYYSVSSNGTPKPRTHIVEEFLAPDSGDKFLSRPLVAPGRARGECTERNKCILTIIADLDQQSKKQDAKKLSFYSILKNVTIWKDDRGSYHVEWGSDEEVVGLYNEAGRGMELSELIYFDGSV